MVIDTSAILAIVWDEQDRERYLRVIRQSPVRLMSAVSAYEAAVVVFGRRKSQEDVSTLWDLLRTLDIEIMPFGYEDAAEAAAAYQAYGKGVHQASLNICDCAAYSLAQSTRLPLLFQGNDFAQTDVGAP